MGSENNLCIKDNVLVDYFLNQREMSKNIIANDLRKTVKFHYKEKDICINFKSNRVVVFSLSKDTVESIQVLDYDFVLNKDFLDDLIKNSNKLDLGLKRLANYEYIDVLKEEVINALSLGRIKISYDGENDKFIVAWKYTDMKFYMNNSFQFKCII